jgi:hypothetical protein
LKKRGLGHIAERLCEELGLKEIDDLRYVKTEGLSKLKWLQDVPRTKLLKLCCEVTACLMSADDSDSASVAAMHQEGNRFSLTENQEFESDREDVLFAARNGGDHAEFPENMRRFIQDFEQ